MRSHSNRYAPAPAFGAPTHRRRRLLTAMMRRQLQEIRACGEPVAALWASEGGIYGRFGYGPSLVDVEAVAHRPAAQPAAPPPRGAPLRVGPVAEHVEAMRAVHERMRPERPGMLDRPGPWWQERLHDPESGRRGAHPLHAVLTDDGYAVYTVRPNLEEDERAGEVRIRELVATTPAARAELWAFLLDLDLTRTIAWAGAPTDEPLWLMLADPRAVRRRILARTPIPTSPSTPRRWAPPTSAARRCGSWRRRRVLELRAGALPRASAAFRGEVAPWCPEDF